MEDLEGGLQKKILQSNLLQIKQEKDYYERFAILTALLYSGSIVKGMAIRDDNMLKAVKDLEAVDKFGKYFGYMITGFANKRSDLSIGFAVPAIKGVNVDDNVNCLTYPVDLVELEYKKAIPIGGGKFLRDITMPLVVILVSRKAGVVDEIIDIIEDEQQLNNVLDFLGTQSSIEKDKKDTNNIFYIEAINTGFDLIQDIIIDSNDEKDITAILTAYKSSRSDAIDIQVYRTKAKIRDDKSKKDFDINDFIRLMDFLRENFNINVYVSEQELVPLGKRRKSSCSKLTHYDYMGNCKFRRRFIYAYFSYYGKNVLLVEIDRKGLTVGPSTLILVGDIKNYRSLAIRLLLKYISGVSIDDIESYFNKHKLSFYLKRHTVKFSSKAMLSWCKRLLTIIKDEGLRNASKK